VIVVVADTSPLNYLIQINCEHILPALYERVFVPTAVVQELDHPRTVAAVRTWLTRVPSWLVVQDVAPTADPQLARLDPGERQAIQLAKREHADLLLMDEKLGVRIAREQGLAVTGTLEILNIRPIPKSSSSPTSPRLWSTRRLDLPGHSFFLFGLRGSGAGRRGPRERPSRGPGQSDAAVARRSRPGSRCSGPKPYRGVYAAHNAIGKRNCYCTRTRSARLSRSPRY